MHQVVVVVSLVLFWSSESSAVDVSCKSDTGSAVDWFVLLKPPGGDQYIYIDTEGKRAASTSIGAGALLHTLSPMLGSVRTMPPSFGFLSYNDQPPGASAKTDLFGHSKGVVLGDSSTHTALWITHSTPQFPFRRDQNSFWPDSGKDQGQTFLCVNLAFSELKAVGNHLQNIRAYPFDYDLTLDFPQELRDAAKWVSSSSLLGAFQTLKTRGNKDLRLMAKPVHYEAKHGDLYVKLAAGFNSDMNAQTWGCQPRRDESFCDRDVPHVMNVEEISIDNKVTWTTKRDHSKWAVTTKANTGWTCFGDVNRSTSQYERWGGAVCLKDKDVNRFFKGFVKKKLDCRKRPAPCSSSEMFSQIEALADDFQEKVEL